MISIVGILAVSQSEPQTTAKDVNDNTLNIAASNVNDDTLNTATSNANDNILNDVQITTENSGINKANGKETKEITDTVIYETISEWKTSGFSLTELGFPKNTVESSSIYHTKAVYIDGNDKNSDIIAEVEFQEEGYHYYLDFIYGYSKEKEGWYAKDIEKCRGTEWLMSQPTDKEIANFFIEKEAEDDYNYSNIEISQREQEYTTFKAKASCTIASSEGTRQAVYIFTWEWENEKWENVQMLEPEPSRFRPINKPNEDFIKEFISQEETQLLRDNGDKKSKIELLNEDWNRTEEEDSYLYECLLVENTKLVETRQNMETEIKFNGETGYWDYENVFWHYGENVEKTYTIDGTWEGVEYETFEASWKYVVEILSVDSENNSITINSWCEFMSEGGEIEKTQVCDGKTMTPKQGEYVIPVGGYIVDHTASKGMNFTYKFIEEDGKLYINEEADILVLSVQNPKMSIALGVEMSLRE